MAKTQLRVALTGGGSGGHIYPLLAVAEALQKSAAEKRIFADIRYFGPNDSYAKVLEAAGLRIHSIAAGKIRRYFSILNLLDVPKFFAGFFQALWKLFFFMPDAVFSKGGPGALPVVLAAWFYRIPVIIHESDAQPGLTNLISAPFAKRIATSFERAAAYFRPSKTACVGSPIRKSLLGARTTEEQAKEELGFKPDQPLLLILGGSQGSQKINELIVFILKDLMGVTQILHQTGAKNFNEIKKLSQAVIIGVPAAAELAHRYEIVPYLEQNMNAALSAADLVVARAGSSIFEIAAFGKPSVLIPLSGSANDHQKTNAYEFSKSGASIVIEEANLVPGILLQQIRDTLKNPELLKKMGLAAAKLFKPQAAEIIVEEILRLAGK